MYHNLLKLERKKLVHGKVFKEPIYNEATHQWAFINADGSFNTAFQLSSQQYEHLIETGIVK